MRIVLAPDKFKHSLTAAQVAEHLAIGLGRVVPGAELIRLPVADGGDGTVEAAEAAGYRRVRCRVTGPAGAPVPASYAVRGDTAVVEAAQACGLQLLAEPAPLTATSRGVGELLDHAVRSGARRIVLGVGGSACTDGGAGMLAALGGTLTDAAGVPLRDGGGALRALARIDATAAVDRLAGVRLVLAADVDAPLAEAATRYAPQKGATAADVAVLAAGLARLAEAVEADRARRAEAVENDRARRAGGVEADRVRRAGGVATGRERAGHGGAGSGGDPRYAPGSGAAGGIGFAALAVLGAHREPGIEVVLELLGFADRLATADLVVTGEGALDAQTAQGKAPAGVARAAAAAGVPAVAVAGRCEVPPARLGLAACYPLSDLEPDPSRSLARAGELVERAAERLARDWCRPTTAGPRGTGVGGGGRTAVPAGHGHAGHDGLAEGTADG